MNAPPTFDTRVAQYVALRDLIKAKEAEHKEKIKPLKDTLEKLNGVMLSHLDKIGGDSVKTGHGTVYRSAKESASIADMSAFWTFVVVNGDFDLVDKKANVTAVKDYIEKNKAPVPGVNYSKHFVVGVRRA
jgi:hypothetical protein